MQPPWAWKSISSMKLLFYRLTIACIFIFVSNCFFDDEERRISKPPAPTPIQILANSLSEGGFQLKDKKIIVLTFYDKDKNIIKPRLGELISEKLTTELVKKGNFKVLDRGIYGKILGSKGLSLSGDMDIATISKVAEALELDGIITGIMYKYGDGIFVNARLLDIKSGLILKAEEVFVAVD